MDPKFRWVHTPPNGVSPPGRRISSRPVNHEPMGVILCGRGVLDGVRITTRVVTQKKSGARDALDGAFHIAPITPLLSPVITPPHKSHLSPQSPCILFVHSPPALPMAGGKEKLGKPRAHLYIYVSVGAPPLPPLALCCTCNILVQGPTANMRTCGLCSICVSKSYNGVVIAHSKSPQTSSPCRHRCFWERGVD